MYFKPIDGKFSISDCIYTHSKSSARCLELGFIIVLFLVFPNSEFLLLSFGFHLFLSVKHKRALSIQ